MFLLSVASFVFLVMNEECCSDGFSFYALYLRISVLHPIFEAETVHQLTWQRPWSRRLDMDFYLGEFQRWTSHEMSHRLKGSRLDLLVFCICCAYQLLSFSALLLFRSTLLQPSQHVVLLITVNSDVLLGTCSSLREALVSWNSGSIYHQKLLKFFQINVSASLCIFF